MSHRQLRVSAWLGAGALTVGLGASVLGGGAVAHADRGDADGGGTQGSRASSHDSRPTAATPHRGPRSTAEADAPSADRAVETRDRGTSPSDSIGAAAAVAVAVAIPAPAPAPNPAPAAADPAPSLPTVSLPPALTPPASTPAPIAKAAASQQNPLEFLFSDGTITHPDAGLLIGNGYNWVSYGGQCVSGPCNGGNGGLLFGNGGNGFSGGDGGRSGFIGNGGNAGAGGNGGGRGGNGGFIAGNGGNGADGGRGGNAGLIGNGGNGGNGGKTFNGGSGGDGGNSGSFGNGGAGGNADRNTPGGTGGSGGNSGLFLGNGGAGGNASTGANGGRGGNGALFFGIGGNGGIGGSGVVGCALEQSPACKVTTPGGAGGVGGRGGLFGGSGFDGAAALALNSPLLVGYTPVYPWDLPPGSGNNVINSDGTADGKNYPPNNGSKPGTIVPDYKLEKGTVLQRFGFPGGGFLAPAGTPFAQLALPPANQVSPFDEYVVADPAALPLGWSIEKSEILGWFGQPGGGTQYRIVDANGNNGSVLALLQTGYLAYK